MWQASVQHMEQTLPMGRRSTSMRWLSVPPEMSLYPNSVSRFAIAAQFFTTCV